MATIGRPLNLSAVLSETKRILHAHSRHFLALSVLFLLPHSFSLIIFPTLRSTLLHSHSPHRRPHQTLLRHAPTPSLPPLHQTLTLTLPLLLLDLLLSLSASITITYSTYRGFHGRPVKLLSAFRPLLSSFPALLATAAASLSLVALLSAAFLSFPFLLTKTLQALLGFRDVDYASDPYFLALSVVVFTLLVLVLVHLKVNWALASVVVVLESSWGLEPLRRSARLMRGMKLTFLSLWMFFGAAVAFFVWVFGSGPSADFGDVWGCLSFVSHTVVGSSCVTVLMLYSVAAHTVLYMYCKALHGELAWDIAEEFAHEYVSLPFDDAKVPHVVFVAPQA